MCRAGTWLQRRGQLARRRTYGRARRRYRLGHVGRASRTLAALPAEVGATEHAELGARPVRLAAVLADHASAAHLSCRIAVPVSCTRTARVERKMPTPAPVIAAQASGSRSRHPLQRAPRLPSRCLDEAWGASPTKLVPENVCRRGLPGCSEKAVGSAALRGGLSLRLSASAGHLAHRRRCAEWPVGAGSGAGRRQRRARTSGPGPRVGSGQAPVVGGFHKSVRKPQFPPACRCRLCPLFLALAGGGIRDEEWGPGCIYVGRSALQSVLSSGAEPLAR
jgi:hypothetical protein